MREITEQLRGCLQYIVLQFIEQPDQAQLRVAEIDSTHLSFRLIVAQPDVAQLIGRSGFTAGAIRSVLNAAAERKGVKVSLQINSHEEEQQRLAALEAKEIIDDGH
ncbi:MAG: KH domain-containing protein [Verrucomicrobia bacterium]|nr:KH domain-containing protein [Verrucomicrobiota bacterium]